MKYFSIFLISCLFICLCVGCIDQNNYPNNIDLLYSKSYENFNDFDEPIEVIDTYDDYISSGYPLGLEKDYFNDKLLYTYTFYHYVMGSDIFLYHSDEITDDILFIYYEINIDVEVLDAEGSYALIFGIDKDLFHSVVDVQVKELKDSNEKIEMLYSGSYLNYHDFEEPVQWVYSYSEYLASDYLFDLDEAYFDEYALYTYSFVHSNLGRNIFRYKDYLLIENNLIIICDINEGITSPAFGDYAIVFAIAKELLNDDLDIIVSPNGLSHMMFDETTEIKSTAISHLLYFELLEEQAFSINFHKEGSWLITDIEARLLNLSTYQEVPMTMFSGLYGYHAILEPSEYILILDIDHHDDVNNFVYIFDCYAKLTNDQ